VKTSAAPRRATDAMHRYRHFISCFAEECKANKVDFSLELAAKVWKSKKAKSVCKAELKKKKKRSVTKRSK